MNSAMSRPPFGSEARRHAGGKERPRAPSNLARMPFDSLAAFVRALRAAGELAVVDAPVDPRLEIAEITDRVVKAGGPALLFTNVAGSRFPVLTNQFGTQRRMARALGAANLDEVSAKLRGLMDLSIPQSAIDRIGKLLSFAPLAAAL